ncbi:MAG: hypothetical protein WC137_02520 [Alphaproteobacteria bacterium]
MNEQSQPFLRGYNVSRLPIIDANGVPAWPSVFPTTKIEELRNIVGPRHFSSQMMLEYIAEDKARLDPGALHFYNGDFDARTAKLGTDKDFLITGISCYWDPSSGLNNADASVCVLLYRDDKNRLAFIHDVKYLIVDDDNLHPLATQCEKVLEFMNQHGAHLIGIEVNGLGNALPEILREIAKKKNQSVVIKKIVNHTRKESRILDTIESLLSTGRLYAHDRIRTTPLISEMLGWTPVGSNGHDDGLDATSGALRMMPTPIRALGKTFRPVRAKTEFKI